VGDLFGVESGKGYAGRYGTSFLEGVEVGGVDLQAARRSHQETSPALVALFHMQMHLAGLFFIFNDGFKWT
jgi:hypothetical protein